MALARAHNADNSTTASTTKLSTKVAIPATSMLVIRLDAMDNFWRLLSDGFDLDQASFREVHRPS
jgi:hypothetical protein